MGLYQACEQLRYGINMGTGRILVGDHLRYGLDVVVVDFARAFDGTSDSCL